MLRCILLEWFRVPMKSHHAVDRPFDVNLSEAHDVSRRDLISFQKGLTYRSSYCRPSADPHARVGEQTGDVRQTLMQYRNTPNQLLVRCLDWLRKNIWPQ